MKTFFKLSASLLALAMFTTVMIGCKSGDNISGPITINEETSGVQGEFFVDAPLTSQHVFVVNFTGGNGTAMVRSTPLTRTEDDGRIVYNSVNGLYIPEQIVNLSGGTLTLPIHGTPINSGEFRMRVEILTGYGDWDRYTVPHFVNGDFVVARPGEGTIFDSGHGFSVSPWTISTVSQLDAIRYYSNRHFLLTSNINLADLPGGWEPIEDFSGTLDGGGFTINNLTHTGLSVDGNAVLGGFITRLDGAGVIRNVAFRNVAITTTARLGVIVGTQFGNIDNIVVSGTATSTLSAGDLFGGITGQMSGGTLTNAHVNLNITSATGMTGGAVGRASTTGPTLIANVTTTGSITISRNLANARVGGILGRAEGTTNLVVSNNYSNMTIGAAAGFNIEGVGGIFGACNNPATMLIEQNMFTGRLVNVRLAGGISGAGPNVRNNLVVGHGGTDLSDPMIIADGNAGVGAIAGSGKFTLRNNIARNVAITGATGAANRAHSGVASIFEQNCVMSNNVVSSILLNATHVNGVAGNNPHGSGSFSNNFRTGMSFWSGGAPSAFTPVDDPAGRDGGAAPAITQSWLEGLGFDFTDIWVMEGGVPMLRDVGYQGDIPTN